MHTVTVKAWVRVYDEHYDAVDLDIDLDIDREGLVTIEQFSIGGEKTGISLLRAANPGLDERIEDAIVTYLQTLKDDGNADE